LFFLKFDIPFFILGANFKEKNQKELKEDSKYVSFLRIDTNFWQKQIILTI